MGFAIVKSSEPAKTCDVIVSSVF